MTSSTDFTHPDIGITGDRMRHPLGGTLPGAATYVLLAVRQPSPSTMSVAARTLYVHRY